METSKRWNKAQEYERAYWKGVADQIAANAEKQLTWYSWKASEFEKKLKHAKIAPGRNARILEVGSGPVGIVAYLKWGEKYALDPLSSYYGENPLLVKVRNKEVNYLTGQGEHIPFPDRHVSLVIIDNVLDHVDTPWAVLDEIRRVLSDSGHLYIELNIHTKWGFVLHRLLSKLSIDKGHPHSFTAPKIRNFLKAHGYDIVFESVNDYAQARDEDRRSKSLKARIKGYLGLSEFIYSAVCSKKG